AWCRWGLAQWVFSPLIQLGQASLLVYWVHIEFVYGRFSILTKRAQTIAGATLGLAIIFFSMLALAYIRTHAKQWLKNPERNPQLGLSSCPLLLKTWGAPRLAVIARRGSLNRASRKDL